MGCGFSIVGLFFSFSGTEYPFIETPFVEMPFITGFNFLMPVRAAEGKICSKPWLAATASVDLKYCKKSASAFSRGPDSGEVAGLP